VSSQRAADGVPTWRPEAIVFDVDGLLVDTEPCWTVAETELFRRRGRPFGDEEKAMLIGRSLAAAAVTLAEDSSTGLRSATAAGLRTVAIPTLTTHELTADWVWSSLDDPTLLMWAQTW